MLSGYMLVTILGNQWAKKSKFEGIILNFDMRHHDGMAVLESLHKQRVETPMIVLSSFSTSRVVGRGGSKRRPGLYCEPVDTERYGRNAFDISRRWTRHRASTFAARERATMMHVADEYERLFVRIYLGLCLSG